MSFLRPHVILPLFLAAAPAVAAPKAAKPVAKAAGKPGAGKVDKAPAVARTIAPELLEKLRGQLFGSDDDPAVDAARQLGESGAAASSAPLIEILAVGTRPPVAAAALEGLGRLKEPKAFGVFAHYSGNRSPELRRRAVKGMGSLKESKVVDILLERLGDPAPDVRQAAAEALAARNEVKAEGRLFLLVRKNDLGAAGPLGAIATPDTVAALADQQGRVDDNVMATALGEYLKRNDAPDPLRVEVIRTLAKIPGASATTALVEYLATVPDKDDRPSKTEAQKVIDQRGSK